MQVEKSRVADVFQMSITERKVYDGRTKLPHLSQRLQEPPCYWCGKLFELCDSENCSKLTEWLQGGP